MRLYCYVEQGAVVSGPGILAPDLSNKSDFELLDLGWYYAECIRPDSFVDRYEVFLPIQFDVRPTKVICTFIKRDKTQAELDAQNAEKQTEVEQDKANRLAFASTFMASDAYAALPVAIKDQWPPYVQTVTDTVTQGLGDAIWDVGFPPQPPTSNVPSPVFPPTADV
jgi:hypothetical protein